MCTVCSGPSLSRLALAVLLSVQVAPAVYAQAGQVDEQGQGVTAPKSKAQPAKAAQAAPAQGSAQEGVLPEVTVVGTNLPVDVQSYPGSVSVVQQEDLGRTSNVIEAMAAVPGVTTGGDSGRSTGQQFNIRGFGYQSEDRVIILQDGVRRSTALYSNHVSSFRADHDLLRRVEIVKGASSVQHGGGGIGGVVAMTTRMRAISCPAASRRAWRPSCAMSTTTTARAMWRAPGRRRIARWNCWRMPSVARRAISVFRASTAPTARASPSILPTTGRT